MALQPRFWRLYASSATSNLADGIGRTALPLLGAAYTRNPVLISGLVTFAFLPWLLFALPSGALVDRVDRRIAMAVANCVRAGSTGVLAVLVGLHHGSIAAIYAVAFLLGLAETVYDSSIRAILPQIVERHDLDRANSLLTVEETLGQNFLGSPVGSTLFAVTVWLPLALNAGGFALAVVLLMTLRGGYRPVRDGQQTSIRRDMTDGVRWLARHRFLRELTILSATSALFGSMVNGVVVLYVLETLRLPSGDFGFVVLAAGVGGLLGGVSTAWLVRSFGRGPVLVVGGVLTGLATAAMSLTRNGYLGALAFAVSAVGVMTWNVVTMSLRQALIPHHLFGRVQGAYRTLVWGGIPVGALLGGVVAKATSIPTVLAVAGAGLTATGLWLVRVVTVHRDAMAEIDTVADTPAVSPAGAS